MTTTTAIYSHHETNGHKVTSTPSSLMIHRFAEALADADACSPTTREIYAESLRDYAAGFAAMQHVYRLAKLAREFPDDEVTSARLAEAIATAEKALGY